MRSTTTKVGSSCSLYGSFTHTTTSSVSLSDRLFVLGKLGRDLETDLDFFLELFSS